MKKFVVILMLVGIVSASQAATLEYTFDTDVEGFVNVTWQETAPTGWSDAPTVQMTHTAGGWQMPMLKEFSWTPGGGADVQQVAMQELANDPAAKLSFDIMVDGGSFPAGAETWYQLIIVGNSDGAAGWTQTQLTDSWHNADDATLYTQHFDLPFATVGWEPGDSWFQLWLGTNSADEVPVNYYLDNVVLIPEPATMVLLGLGGLILRRRK